ncbi:peptidase S8/S53 domain-containing protein, partial [Podospora fimiseda]
LCEPLTKHKTKAEYRLELKVKSGQLFKLQSERSMSLVDKTKDPVSLQQVLAGKRHSFTDKTRRILAVLLSSAVLHLHDTQWLPPSWSSSDILFFPTISSAIPLRPFIHTQLHDAGTTFTSTDTDDFEDDDFDPDDLLRHQCPAVVTLAIMLMEVYFAEPFKDLAAQYRVKIEAGTDYLFNTRYIDAHLVFKACQDDIPEYSRFRYALEKCLDLTIWEDDNGDKLDQQILRTKIYEEVVQPLEIELSQAYSYIPIDDLDRFAQNLNFASWDQSIQVLSQQIQAEHSQNVSDHRHGGFSKSPGPQAKLAYSRSQLSLHHPSRVLSPSFGSPGWVYHGNTLALSQTKFPMHSQYAAVDPREAKFFDDEALPDATDEACHSYEKWKKDYEAVCGIFIPENLVASPVKIAILDTGLDLTHPDMKARMERIKGQYNWLSDKHPTAVHDRNGHGTFATGLLMDYAPHAEIFIGKIAENKPSCPRTIANAINYAVSVWKVDMISMSFGFPTCVVERYEELEKALQNAKMNNVLLFAAASNSGGRLDLAYPAREDCVIAVYSTDTNGNRSTFSPTAASQGVSLATVGEAVESAWPVHLCDEERNPNSIDYKSGTSYATPILTGIAAFLLLYARINLPVKAESMKKLRRMRDVLVRVAEKGANRGRKLRDEYHFVDLSLYNDCLFGKDKVYINSVLSDLLTN